MTSFCVTVDHELPSSGGDPWACGIGPAGRIAAACERFGAPITWFPDALAWAGHAEAEEQLRGFAGRGHEIGVHLHPEHREPGATCASSARLDDWTAEAVQWVADLSAAPMVIRAGGWHLPAGDAWARLMRRHGLRVDSSILPGRWLAGAYDFREVPERDQWRFAAHPNRPGGGDLVELPVTTRRIGRLRDAWGLSRVRGGPPGCDGQRARTAIPLRLLALGVAVLDPCAQPEANLRRVLQGRPDGVFVCVVHTQRFSDQAHAGLSFLLDRARARGWRFRTLSGAAECP